MIQGIGDDAAVITSRAGQWTVLTTDLLTEGFTSTSEPPRWPISDSAPQPRISATSRRWEPPLNICSSPWPSHAPASRHHVLQLYRGMMAACRPHHVQLIGGDTSASSGGWFLSLTLIGMVPPRKALFRSGARIGDHLYVTGTIGDALAGLRLLNEPPPRAETPPAGRDALNQAPAISDRTAPASNRAHCGRPVAQYPSLRHLRDRYFRRPLRRPPSHLRGKPCRSGAGSERASVIAGLPRLCSLSKTRPGGPRADGRRRL